MFWIALWLVGIARCHGDSRVTDANLFMDSVFLTQMPKVVASAGLEPVKLSPFGVSVVPPKLGDSRSLMPASDWSFDEIDLQGLSDVVRSENCSAVAIRAGNITVTCRVSLGRLRVALTGSVVWDDSREKRQPARTLAQLTRSYAVVVAAGPQRYKPGSLIRFDVTDLNLVYAPNYEPLSKKLSKKLRSRVKKILETEYRAALVRAVARVNLPAA
ncbi:uncharacterized protein LOC100907610 [Galendromus occidentalis]|uniref:Uncharacterized protein LOC100907610 n=1 Tax=Galendromus occidentalis TaxID=34638 RepID=A0AAJ6VYK3_9ACAR|nr:uncharacterized protein LOC100907610 [Galendromus occidentalis]